MVGRMISLVAGVAVLAAPLPASAKSASNLRDLVGARAAGAEREIQRRGFVLTDGHKGEKASYTYWWNSARRDCVMVRTREGRYASINDVSAADCNQQNHHGSSGKASAAGVAIGALIGAAILAHKSGHHDDGQHHSDAQQDADYERGYRDGLHGQPESAYGGNDAYRSGYLNGVEQRGREIRYDQPNEGSGYGGPTLELGSLVGARAAGVETEMQANGFRSVDGFESGNMGRGVVWWNGRTRQCVQIITVNGRSDSVMDIGTHPRCR